MKLESDAGEKKNVSNAHSAHEIPLNSSPPYISDVYYPNDVHFITSCSLRPFRWRESESWLGAIEISGGACHYDVVLQTYLLPMKSSLGSLKLLFHFAAISTRPALGHDIKDVSLADTEGFWRLVHGLCIMRRR